ncbi:hypothetical protein SCLCIDRAFT_1223518, partial [Scleroderma citrinum Foug A]
MRWNPEASHRPYEASTCHLRQLQQQRRDQRQSALCQVFTTYLLSIHRQVSTLTVWGRICSPGSVDVPRSMNAQRLLSGHML